MHALGRVVAAVRLGRRNGRYMSVIDDGKVGCSGCRQQLPYEQIVEAHWVAPGKPHLLCETCGKRALGGFVMGLCRKRSASRLVAEWLPFLVGLPLAIFAFPALVPAWSWGPWWIGCVAVGAVAGGFIYASNAAVGLYVAYRCGAWYARHGGRSPRGPVDVHYAAAE